eukprot:263195-Hanusia_phi.AAC.1
MDREGGGHQLGGGANVDQHLLQRQEALGPRRGVAGSSRAVRGVKGEVACLKAELRASGRASRELRVLLDRPRGFRLRSLRCARERR